MKLSDFKIRRVKDLDSAIQGLVDITEPVIVYYKSETGFGWGAILFYRAKFLGIHYSMFRGSPSEVIKEILIDAQFHYACN